MKIFMQALKLFCILTIVTGIFYPLTVAVLAQMCFPYQANGSLIYKNGQLAGSELLAQKFQDPKYFWSRPSAADYATIPSGASNQGPTSAALKELVSKRAAEFRKANHLSGAAPLPADVLFASGSGLDPHISPEAAQLQVARIAEARHLSESGRKKLEQLLETYTEPPQFGVFGKPRVNVFRLNLELDTL